MDQYSEDMVGFISAAIILYGILLLIAPIWIIALLQRHKSQNRAIISQLAEANEHLRALSGRAPSQLSDPEAKPKKPTAKPVAEVAQPRPPASMAGSFMP